MVGQLTQALGGAARGRTERNTVIHSLIQGENRIDRCCFAGAGAAGQDHHPAGQRQPDRLLLQRCIGETLCDLQCASVGVQRLGGLGREGRKLEEKGRLSAWGHSPVIIGVLFKGWQSFAPKFLWQTGFLGQPHLKSGWPWDQFILTQKEIEKPWQKKGNPTR